MKDTWRKLIAEEMELRQESFEDVIACTLTDDQLDQEFYSGYGNSQGKPFTLWTFHRVYFPVVYDTVKEGSLWHKF